MFSSNFLRMGTYYVLPINLGMIGVWRKGNAMRDLYIQSEIVAEKSIGSVLKGSNITEPLDPTKFILKPCGV